MTTRPGGPLAEHPSHTIPLDCNIFLKPQKSTDKLILIEVRLKKGFVRHEHARFGYRMMTMIEAYEVMA